MRFVFFLFLLLALCGCQKGCHAIPVTPPKPVPPTEEESVERAAQERATAEKTGDRLEILEAEKRELRAQFAKAQKDMKVLGESLTAKEVEIKQEHMDRTQDRAYLISGIAGFTGLICIAASLFITTPLLAKIARWAALTFGAIGVLALVFAWLVPYLLPIVSGLAVVVGIAVVWQWKGDHKGFTQVIKAVEPLKNSIEGANEKLRGALTQDVQNRVNAIRTAAGLKKNT